MSIKRMAWCLLLTSLVSVPVVGDEPEPPGLPPQFYVVSKIDREARNVEVRTTLGKTVYQVETVQKEVDGKTVVEAINVPRVVTETVTRSLRLEGLRVVTAAKERLDVPTALERLEPGMVILLVQPGTKFDPRYLSALNPKTLVLLEKELR